MSSLSELLAREVELLRQFVQTLENEQVALRTGDVDGLPTLTEEKAALFPQLAAIGKAREDYLLACGQAEDKTGLQDWLARHPEDKTSILHWQALLELAQTAKALNALNGTLIQIRMNANDQALQTLTQQSPQAGLYSAKGTTGGYNGYRLIDSA